MDNTPPPARTARVSVITDEAILAKLNPMTDHISVFLVRKGQLEQRRQDVRNPTILGGVKFWFQIDDRSGSIILCYDKQPVEWDIDAILKDINDQEHMFYVQAGFQYLDLTGY